MPSCHIILSLEVFNLPKGISWFCFVLFSSVPASQMSIHLSIYQECLISTLGVHLDPLNSKLFQTMKVFHQGQWIKGRRKTGKVNAFNTQSFRHWLGL